MVYVYTKNTNFCVFYEEGFGMKIFGTVRALLVFITFSPDLVYFTKKNLASLYLAYARQCAPSTKRVFNSPSASGRAGMVISQHRSVLFFTLKTSADVARKKPGLPDLYWHNIPKRGKI
jgi:hypothetical protein